MRPTSLYFSAHALRRLAQRNLHPEDVRLVCTFGQTEYRAGLVCYFLGRRHLPIIGKPRDYEHLVGITVLCCPHCYFVVTVYQNGHGLREHRKKSKHTIRDERCVACGH